MRLLIVSLTVGLAGCSALPNGKVCTPINDVESVDGVPSAEVLKARQHSLPWQRQRVEACLHRNAYRFAKADAGVSTIADALIERCQPAVGITVSLAGTEEMRLALVNDEEPFAAKGRGEREEFTRLKRLASYWVVEGRAGNCRG